MIYYWPKFGSAGKSVFLGLWSLSIPESFEWNLFWLSKRLRLDLTSNCAKTAWGIWLGLIWTGGMERASIWWPRHFWLIFSVVKIFLPNVAFMFINFWRHSFEHNYRKINLESIVWWSPDLSCAWRVWLLPSLNQTFLSFTFPSSKKSAQKNDLVQTRGAIELYFNQ